MERGYLVISDISGFTRYLNKSELDHASDSLSDLLRLLVESTSSPLEIVELEGDAVFSYAPEAMVSDGAILREMVENAYVSFRHALDLMIVNTTCTCTACRLLPSLDLKFFLHFGSFVRQVIGDHAKLVGNDVNLIHRLLKNDISEETGLQAYAAYTEPALTKLGLDKSQPALNSHSEAFPDVGEIRMYVEDMHEVWERRRDSVRVRVPPETALLTADFDFEVNPSALWNYVTNPTTRSLLLGSDWQRLDPRPGGDIGRGATYVCAHGSNRILQTIVDWQPPRTYTVCSGSMLPKTTSFTTCHLEPLEAGTRMRVLWGRGRGPLPLRLASDLFSKTMGIRGMHQGIHALRERIRRDLAQGELPEDSAIPSTGQQA